MREGSIPIKLGQLDLNQDCLSQLEYVVILQMVTPTIILSYYLFKLASITRLYEVSITMMIVMFNNNV
jgi:hypothetical protein